MGVPFIGDSGFYPTWARGAGRWVRQRVPITHAGWLHMADDPDDDDVRWLVWSPPTSRFRWLASRREHEAHYAWDELFWLGGRLSCWKCGPQGANVAPHIILADPSNWWVTCRHCQSSLDLDLTGLDFETIVRRWHEKSRPVLDPPHAARSAIVKGVGPVGDLEDWIARMKPMPIEMAYIGQQLWPDLLSFLDAAAPKPSLRRKGSRSQR